jgi:hypothetical protein
MTYHVPSEKQKLQRRYAGYLRGALGSAAILRNINHATGLEMLPIFDTTRIKTKLKAWYETEKQVLAKKEKA